MTGEMNSAAHVRLLLCSRLGLSPGDIPKPLSPREFTALEQAVAQSEWREISALLGQSAAELDRGLSLDVGDAERIERLLARGGQLAIELDQLSRRGLWVVTRGDAGYPQRWLDRLQERAPVVLFGAGELALLSRRPAVAIVGSRETDDVANRFTSRLAECCAAAGAMVVSGGARGTDRLAMTAAIGNGGLAVGVLADDLSRAVRDPETRALLADQRLALVTPVHYSAGFSIGNAMGRNKLIYCLADFAVVISAAEETGGTWAGAQENLKAQWVPMLVRSGPDVPAGNAALVRQQAIPVTEEELVPDLLPMFARKTQFTEPRSVAPVQQSFGFNTSE